MAPFGVFLRKAANAEIFCHTPCYSGFTDCRLSGTIWNWKVVINEHCGPNRNKVCISPGYGQGGVAWYINKTQFRQGLVKCSWGGDGGTMDRYNMGCGCAATHHAPCGNKTSAYEDMDPATGYTKKNTADSAAVVGCWRGNGSWGGYYKGVAWRKDGGDSVDETNQMLRHRAYGSQKSKYNEVMLDGERFLEYMAADASRTVPAITYFSSTPQLKQQAVKVARAFMIRFKTHAPVPVIRINLDADINRREDVFIFEGPLDEHSSLTASMYEVPRHAPHARPIPWLAAGAGAVFLVSALAMALRKKRRSQGREGLVYGGPLNDVEGESDSS